MATDNVVVVGVYIGGGEGMPGYPPPTWGNPPPPLGTVFSLHQGGPPRPRLLLVTADGRDSTMRQHKKNGLLHCRPNAEFYLCVHTCYSVYYHTSRAVTGIPIESDPLKEGFE